jgi:hypothetical protein
MTVYLIDRPVLTSQVNAACWTTSRRFANSTATA